MLVLGSRVEGKGSKSTDGNYDDVQGRSEIYFIWRLVKEGEQISTD